MLAFKEILDYPPSTKNQLPSKLLFKNSSNPNSFHDAMKRPITLMQMFGFFPLKGVRGPNFRSLTFKWKSWGVFYSILSLFGYSFNFVLYCKVRSFKNILEVNAILFDAESITLSILFFLLAMQWPKFVRQWYQVELSMKNYELSINLKRRLTIIMVVILSIAFVEHIMITGSRIVFCIKAHPRPYDAMYEYFVYQTFSEIFSIVTFYVWLGVLFQMLILQKTFMWTFLDVFIILVSTCFTFRLRQISKKLTYLAKIEVADLNVWRSTREDYVKLSRLCDLINKRLCWFIIISYLTNIYHILSQLFSSLRPIENTFEKIYFYVSFFLLILRVTSVCVFGGAVHDEHGEIVKILTSVPSSVYNVEVERFVTHMATCDMVLSGKHFFRITRNLILKVASAIVTYELVLIQFNTKDFKKKD